MHMILVLAFIGVVESGDETNTAGTAAPTEKISEATAQAEVVVTPQNVVDWSVGAGIGVAVFSSNGLRQSYAPTVRAGIERRIATHTWLMLDVSASYHESSSPAVAGLLAAKYYGAGGGLNLGVRQAFDLAGLVTLSPYAGLSAGVFNGSGTYDQRFPSSDTVSYDLGAEAGLIVERELVEGFALRFSSSVLRASYSKSTTKGVGSRTNLAMGLGFTPTLEARLYW